MKLAIRLVDDSGKVYKTLNKEYNPMRLRRKQAKEVQATTSVLNFTEYDMSGAMEGGDTSKAIKGVDTAAWLQSREDAKEKLVLLLWGATELKEEDYNNIAVEDYAKMEGEAHSVLLAVGLVEAKKKEEEIKKQNG